MAVQWPIVKKLIRYKWKLVSYYHCHNETRLCHRNPMYCISKKSWLNLYIKIYNKYEILRIYKWVKTSLSISPFIVPAHCLKEVPRRWGNKESVRRIARNDIRAFYQIKFADFFFLCCCFARFEAQESAYFCTQPPHNTTGRP